MFGVRPVSKSVEDLLAIPTLKKAGLSKFAAKEIRRINAIVPSDYVNWQDPTWGSAAEVGDARGAANGDHLPNP